MSFRIHDVLLRDFPISAPPMLYRLMTSSKTSQMVRLSWFHFEVEWSNYKNNLGNRLDWFTVSSSSTQFWLYATLVQLSHLTSALQMTRRGPINRLFACLIHGIHEKLSTGCFARRCFNLPFSILRAFFQDTDEEVERARVFVQKQYITVGYSSWRSCCLTNVLTTINISTTRLTSSPI